MTLEELDEMERTYGQMLFRVRSFQVDGASIAGRLAEDILHDTLVRRWREVFALARYAMEHEDGAADCDFGKIEDWAEDKGGWARVTRRAEP